MLTMLKRAVLKCVKVGFVQVFSWAARCVFSCLVPQQRSVSVTALMHTCMQSILSHTSHCVMQNMHCSLSHMHCSLCHALLTLQQYAIMAVPISKHCVRNKALQNGMLQL
jgi:hypothetical protein